MAGGRGAVRRLISVALFVGAASAALAAAGPDALLPFKDAAGAATEVSVAFVVDFGSLGAPVVGCVQVPSTDNGYAALGAFTAGRGEATPIYNNAGLLCSIDNLPVGAPAVCGAQVPGGYDYWSYWHGTTSSWVYASTGAFSPVQNGDVEGWRFETNGQSNPTDPHPSPAPSYSSICGSVVSAAATTAPPTTAPNATAPNATAPPTANPAPATAVPPVSGRGSGGQPSGGPAVPGGSSAPAGPVGGPTDATGATGAASSATATPTTVPSGSASPAQSLRASPATDDRAGAGGSAVPGIIGVLLVLALVIGAVLGWRRRARPQ